MRNSEKSVLERCVEVRAEIAKIEELELIEHIPNLAQVLDTCLADIRWITCGEQWMSYKEKRAKAIKELQEKEEKEIETVIKELKRLRDELTFDDQLWESVKAVFE